MFGLVPDPVVDALAIVGFIALVGTGALIVVGIIREVLRP
jgi:hypothetical protein